MKGTCHCGRVTYEIDRLDAPLVHCHCRSCRKTHAAVYAPTAVVKREHFRFLSGKQDLSSYRSSPGKVRLFCSTCGCHVVAERDGEERVLLRVATLDDNPNADTSLHIWRSHDLDWLLDGTDTPSFQEWGPQGAH